MAGFVHRAVVMPWLLRKSVVVIALCSIVFSGVLQAIVMRHDVQPEKYIAFARQFSAIATFWGQFQGKASVEGTGTLIAQRWILTAAHVAHRVAPGAQVQIGQKFYRVKRSVSHPDWRDQQFANDIALVELAESVAIKNMPQLYSQGDEQGKVLTFIGRGDSGNGVTGITSADATMRAATNQVIQAEDQWLRFSFDQGASALPLEGISGPGDSGGPALLKQGDNWYLLGVSAWQNAEPTQWQEGRYGVIENYSRVSHHIGWIRQVMAGTTENTAGAANSNKAAAPLAAEVQ